MPSPSDLLTTDVDEAVDALAAGGLVAIPTETVYGLAAVADQPDAVRRIFEVKGRPRDHPLIVHLAGVEGLDGWVADVPRSAAVLAATCWPGPLTMLLARGPRCGDWVTGGGDTVGIRVPANELTLAVLDRLGTGLAAPSANRFGKVSPTTAHHVLDDLGHLLDPARDRILDGGPCQVGVESTIVDLTVDPPQLLRAGAIDADTIARLLDTVVAGASGPRRAAGMLASHYAPECRILLAEASDDLDRMVARARADGASVAVLDRTDDLVVAARRLYDDLRAADRAGTEVLVVRMPPAAGLGHALRDRLTKAAAGR
jgi:L-threonylcarbamoyladenylate synthase